MRYLIPILLFLSQACLGQKRIEPTPYQKKATELTQNQLRYHINVVGVKSMIRSYRPYQWVKITLKPNMNTNILSKIRIAEMMESMESEDTDLGEAIDMGLSDLDLTDYMSIIAYDLRVKIYLQRNSAIVLRCFVTGIQLNTYNYTLGYRYRF